MALNDIQTKRLGLFVFFDPDGHVGRFIDYFLQDLTQNLDRLVVICNGLLSEEERAVFEKYTGDIFVRENKGYDVSAWKAALTNFVGWDNLYSYDEVVFLNDSCYGPLYPLKYVFEEMAEKKELEFWGLTRHFESEDTTGHHKNGILPAHIQSYFIVVRRRMLLSKEFRDFWTKLPRIKNYNDAIGLYETKFTQHFANLGFIWDTYVKMDDFKQQGRDNFSANYEIPYALTLKYKMPVIRRKSLTQTCINSSNGPEKEARRLIEYVDKYTDYDVSMIWEDLLRRNNIADIYSRLHLNYILPVSDVIYPSVFPKKIALLIHIYYKDQIEYCFSYAKNMPEYADVYITTVSGNETYVKDTFSGLICNKLEVRTVENRGRDMSALYVGCGDVLGNGMYDYICCIHDKKSTHCGKLFGDGFRDITFENTLASKEFVENILGIFEREHQLGLLSTPFMIGGSFWHSVQNSWMVHENYQNTVELLKKCGINTRNMSESKPPISYANIFWCRPTALKPLNDLNLNYEDFDEEPLALDGTFSHALERAVTYAAQSQGFYSGVLYTDEYASIYNVALIREYQSTCDPRFIRMRTHLKNAVKSALASKPGLYKFFRKLWGKIRRKKISDSLTIR